MKGSGPAFVGTLIAERVEWYSRMLRAELAKYVTEHPAISGYFAPQAVEIMKSEAIRDPKGKLVGSISTKFSTAPKVS